MADGGEVLIIMGDAVETVDTLYPYFRLQEDGFEPVVAGPEKRLYQMVCHEVKSGWTITREWEGYTIQADIAFSDVRVDEYLGIFFSGGRAPEYIRDDVDVIRITQHFFDAQKPIASVCHGVEIPTRADRVRGRRMATVAKCRFDLEVCGGIYVDEACVIDGNLVSGRTWHDHAAYVAPWIAMLRQVRRTGDGQGGAHRTRPCPAGSKIFRMVITSLSKLVRSGSPLSRVMISGPIPNGYHPGSQLPLPP